MLALGLDRKGPEMIPALWHNLGLIITLGLVVAVAAIIEFSGGLPSQLAHAYYLPIVLAALTLNRISSLAVAGLAILCVTPPVDVLHHVLNRDVYYDDPWPLSLSQAGWMVRPISFLFISFFTFQLTQERLLRMRQQSLSEARGAQIQTLSYIDKLILTGKGERESIQEISRFMLELHGSTAAGIVLPGPDNRREVIFTGFMKADMGSVFRTSPPLPFGEGVTGWAMMPGRTSWTRNINLDPRYPRLGPAAAAWGIVASAAAAVVLDGEILGALVISYDYERDFSPDDLSSLEHVADQAALAIANARQRENLERMALDTAMVLSSVIESRDAYTADHCERLVAYAEVTAIGLALPPKQIELVKLGAALHDVGKIAISDSILRKAGPLTPEEYAAIKQHCYTGSQICKRVPFLEPVQSLVYHHHERFDGTGYPDGLRGYNIPVGARIIAVVDAYDAMTSDRPYRASIGHEAAMEVLLQGSDKQWDPRVVEVFKQSQDDASRLLHAA